MKNNDTLIVKDFLKRWYDTFAKNVSNQTMETRVLAKGNHPWHIFTWGEATAKEKEQSKSILEVYHDKLNQVMQYDSLLKNLLDKNIKTIPYVIMYKPEEENDKILEDNIKHNESNLNLLVDLIKRLYNTDQNALEQLQTLE